MRTLFAIALLSAASLAYAADPKKDDIPPPPPMPATVDDGQSNVEPEIVVTKKADATITEYRIGGRVYMQKVQPAVGPAYYLLDENGSGSFVHRDTDPLQPPRWVIKTF